MNKVLIITYYWPPSGGVGVQRWLKFSKYLPENGWEPVILTPENPAFDLRDDSLVKDIRPETEVLKLPIWEPYKIAEKFSAKKGQENLNRGMALEGDRQKLSSRLMLWLRGNLLIPDPRMFWIRPATDFALRILDNNNIKAIITTGPPHSMHLIGRRLKKKTGLPWIADFRDPWSKWEILHRMNVSTPAMKIHQSLERKVLTEADVVLAASPGIAEGLADSCPDTRLEVLTNGYDPQDIPAEYSPEKLPEKFRISYVGLLNAKRNPAVLWEVLEGLCKNESGFAESLEVALTGGISKAVFSSAAAFPLVKERLVSEGNIPHELVFERYQKAAVLLMLIDDDKSSRAIIPAKLFEYLAAGKPVLYIGDPENEAGRILEAEEAGKGFSFKDSAGIKEYVLKLFRAYQSGNYKARPLREKYSRKEQASELASLLAKLTAS